MKKTLILGLLALSGSAHAFTVYDPAVHSQLILSSVKEVAKFVEMIGNQVKQLKVLEEEAANVRRHADAFGNPAQVKPAGAELLRKELDRAEKGIGIQQLLATADPAQALAHDGGGIFHAVPEKFTTPQGKEVKRVENLYRPVAALQATTENFKAVSLDAAARRTALKGQIAQTIQALANASTDAEVQKFASVLTGLQAALQATDAEIEQASATAVVQEVATRADDRRQLQAAREEQAAEFTEALTSYGQTFRLMTQPVAFPIP